MVPIACFQMTLQLLDKFYMKQPSGEDVLTNAFKAFTFTREPFVGQGVLFWEYRRFHDLVGIKNPLNKYWKNIMMPKLQEFPLELCGVFVGSMVPSKTALNAQCKKEKRPMTALERALVQQEFIAPTKLILAALAELSVGAKTKKFRGNAASTARSFLELAIGSDSLSRVFSQVKCCLPGDFEEHCGMVTHGPHCAHQLIVIGVTSVAEMSGTVGVTSLMRELFEQTKACGRCCVWLRRVLTCMSDAAEISLIEMGSRSVQKNPEGILQPRGQKRARRLDADVLEHMASSMVSSGRYRSAARAAKATGQVAPTTGRYAEEMHMASYVWSSAKEFNDVAYLSVVNDDVRAGGEKNQLGAVWSTEKQKAAWLCPQVRCTVGAQPVEFAQMLVISQMG